MYTYCRQPMHNIISFPNHTTCALQHPVFIPVRSFRSPLDASANVDREAGLHEDRQLVSP